MGVIVLIKAIIFDAFGTLFKVVNGGSARTIMSFIRQAGNVLDEKKFIAEWKAYYKRKTIYGNFMTERSIFISRIQMFYERYNVSRNAEKDADVLLSSAYERGIYPEVIYSVEELRKKYRVFIGSNTDNDVLHSVMRRNKVSVDGVFTSEDIKCYKPNIEFYNKILSRTGLSAQETVFAGDSVTDDVIGAKGAGMKAILIDRNNEYSVNTADMVLDRLPLPEDIDIIQRVKSE